MSDGENEVGRPAQAGIEESFPSGPVQEGIRSLGEQGRQARGNGSDAKDIRTKEFLTYQWERFSAIARELPPLFLRHWKEVGLNREKIPLDPDWDKYFASELSGMLRCLTVRSNGALVGYVFLYVIHHESFSTTLTGIWGRHWLDPAYREGYSGYKMMKEADSKWREWGVKLVYGNTPFGKRGESLFKRLGYSPVETVMSKVL